MNITFFIGNGFDLQVGLNTRYLDFYHACAKKMPNNGIIKQIEKTPELWQELEVQLGKYTSAVDDRALAVFYQNKIELENKLAEYLESEQSRIRYEGKEKEIGEEIRRSLIGFADMLSEKEREEIGAVFHNLEAVEYQFIDYNYTDVLDRCIDIAKRQMPIIDTHISETLAFPHTYGDVLHIHGTAADGLILGVNDSSQLDIRGITESGEFRSVMMKPQTNQELGENRIQKAERILADSQIVCVFGMSLGITDRLWWGKLAAWLKKDASRRLIIYQVDDRLEERVNPAQKIIGRNQVRREFLEKAGVPRNQWGLIEDAVYVAKNPGLFQLKLVK